MTVKVETVKSAVKMISVDGRLDQSQNSELEQTLMELLDTGQNRLLVDLSQTSYINSGGLRTLVTAWRKARQQKGNLVLSGLNERLQEVFSMVGFDNVFQIFPTTVEAIVAYEDN